MSFNQGAYRFLPRQKPLNETPSAQFRSPPKFIIRGPLQEDEPRTPTRRVQPASINTDRISDTETNDQGSSDSDLQGEHESELQDENERNAFVINPSIRKTSRFIMPEIEGQVPATHYAKRYRPLPDTPEKGPAAQDFSPSKRKRGVYIANGLAATTANWVANVQSITASTSTYPYSNTVHSIERVDEVIVANTNYETILLAGPKAGRNNRHNRTLQPGETIKIAEPVYALRSSISGIPQKLCVNWSREKPKS